MEIDPNVPAGMSTSFFNLLTDTGSQEPELADVIEDENETPPYDTDEYPGGAGNASVPMTVQYGAISAQEVDGRVGPFVAPCGLIEIDIRGYDVDGGPIATADMPAIDLLLHVAPGTYKGVAAIQWGSDHMKVEAETCIEVGKWASIANHVRANRIEYLLLIGILHLVGITNKAYSHVSGVCL